MSCHKVPAALKNKTFDNELIMKVIRLAALSVLIQLHQQITSISVLVDFIASSKHFDQYSAATASKYKDLTTLL